jgi:hypothetical protein
MDKGKIIFIAALIGIAVLMFIVFKKIKDINKTIEATK